MTKLKVGLGAILVLVLASAVVAYYGNGMVQAYFEGRVDVIDATGRKAVTDATARQVDAVTLTMQRQSSMMSLLAGLGALQGAAIVALLVYIAARQRNALPGSQRGEAIVERIIREDGTRVTVYRAADLVRRG